MSKSKKLVHASFEIDFIPGLAPGGKAGEGLGRRLLGSIRDSDAILAVLRADDSADPADALDALELELVLADLGSVEQRLEKQRRALKGDTSLAAEVAALERAEAVLADGTPVFRSELDDEERRLLAPVFLLTNKPMLVVVNVAVDGLDRAEELAAPFGPDALSVCVEIEGDPDVAQAAPDERAALLADLGVAESVLPRLARSAYHLLGRRTFFTTGEDESRAWSFRAGAKAPECAGVIHSDLQRGFIRAEVVDWRELLDIGSWDKAKEMGKLRVEGKEYEVRDGDVLEIRFNV
jgi:GTP-binding protein YchF